MKKRLILVTYTFNAVEVITKSRIVSVMFDREISDSLATQTACEAVAKNFKKSNPDFELIKIYGEAPLVATVSDYDLKSQIEDGYSADMSIDRIDHLIGEKKPYTDRVVLNGWAPTDTIIYFQSRRGYYVNTFEDQDNHDQYTVIKW